MKTAVALLSLILVVSCTADQYELKCSRNELGILWPNYDDATQYYLCQNVGKPVVMSCNPGTVFTFVYQSCTLQSEYIPAPPLYNLPTDSPGGSTQIPGTTRPPFTLPTPQTPSGSNNSSSSSTTKSTATTATTKTSTVTTPKTTVVTTPTTAKTTQTTSGPTPPTPPTPPGGSTPPGGVPNPPSPPPSGIPMPSTPAVTPPVIDTAPPNALPTVPSFGQ